MLSPADQQYLRDNNLADALLERGIGGQSHMDTVRCFHMLYAQHLARGGVAGARAQLCSRACTNPLTDRGTPAVVEWLERTKGPIRCNMSASRAEYYRKIWADELMAPTSTNGRAAGPGCHQRREAERRSSATGAERAGEPT